MYIIALGLVFLTASARAQNIGIGTTQPDASAALDISSSSKGLLIPRMDLAIAAPTAPANGLLVFNTNTAYGRGAGIYINMGTGVVPRWMQLQPDSSRAFIQNRQTPQANTDFNISGSGTIGQSLKVDGLLDVNDAIKASGDISTSGNFILDVKYLTREFTIDGNSYAILYLSCPAGYRLLSGGGGHRDANSAVQDISIAYSGPDAANPSGRWRLAANNTSKNSRAMIIYCNCAKIK